MALNSGSKAPASSTPLPVENLEALLSQSLGNGMTISRVNWKHLTDPGENFGSLILAVDLDVIRDNNTKTLHLVVKLPPRSAYLLDLFNSPVTFEKELNFYRDVVPAFKQLQFQCGVQRDISSLVPEFFGGRLGLRDPEKFDEQAAIILENLNYARYSVCDRIFGLDKQHVEFAIKELAKLHAITICLKIKKPQFFKSIVLPVLTSPANEAAKSCVLDMINKARENLKCIEKAKPYLDRINKTLQYGIDNDDDNQVAEEPWATLIHNDFWVNNMMFRHDEVGNIADMKIVDFQLCVYGYGINDLIFFLISSSKEEVLDNNFDQMIDLYYDSFVKSLKLLEVDTQLFPKHKFDEYVNYCAPVKFAQCIMMVQVIQATRGSAPKMEDINNKNVFLSLSSDIYDKKLLQIVSIFDKKGWLLR